MALPDGSDDAEAEAEVSPTRVGPGQDEPAQGVPSRELQATGLQESLDGDAHEAHRQVDEALTQQQLVDGS